MILIALPKGGALWDGRDGEGRQTGFVASGSRKACWVVDLGVASSAPDILARITRSGENRNYLIGRVKVVPCEGRDGEGLAKSPWQ
jgi:hypothetical protein